MRISPTAAATRSSTRSLRTAMPPASARQLGKFIEAGADHVCVQLLHATVEEDPVPGYRQLAAALSL